MKSVRLQKHVFLTYTRLRYGLALLAAVYPVLLYAGGSLVYGISPRNTMSEYYYAAPAGSTDAPMRVWFVGLLFAIGVFLMLYRGFTQRENFFLNAAGVLAICVAVFPMPWGCGADCPALNPHRLAAVLFFACIAYVSIRCARDTLYPIQDERLRARYRRRYRLIGLVMLFSPVVALFFSGMVGGLHRYVYAFETVGIWSFAYYWWTKSRELAFTGAELLALQGRIGD
jgi:hypothetical protein